MAPPVQRRFRQSALLLAALFLAACGGTDSGRPKATTPNVAAVDACVAGDGLTFQNIMDFEPAALPFQHHARCDPFVNSTKNECTYLNFDVTETARSYTTLPACTPTLTTMCSPASCLQANGQPLPDGTTMVSSGVPLTMGDPNLTLSPVPDATGSRCGVSSNAFHFTATNVAACYNRITKKQGWGATIQITFNASTGNSGVSTLAVDASAWDGVSFWERRGSGTSAGAADAGVTDGGAPPEGGALLFSVQDPYSSSALSVMNFTRPPPCPAGVTSADCFTQCSTADFLPAPPPPKPDPMIPTPDAAKCDAFGLGVGLSDDWRLVKIPFRSKAVPAVAGVQQKGFGVPSSYRDPMDPDPSHVGELDTAALVGIQISLSAGNWDVWIDDIAFYKEAP